MNPRLLRANPIYFLLPKLFKTTRMWEFPPPGPSQFPPVPFPALRGDPRGSQGCGRGGHSHPWHCPKISQTFQELPDGKHKAELDLKEEKLRFRACKDPAFPFLPPFFWRREGAKVFPVPPRALGNPREVAGSSPSRAGMPRAGHRATQALPNRGFTLPQPHFPGFIGPGSPGDGGFCVEFYPKLFLQLLHGQKKKKKIQKGGGKRIKSH